MRFASPLVVLPNLKVPRVTYPLTDPFLSQATAACSLLLQHSPDWVQDLLQHALSHVETLGGQH